MFRPVRSLPPRRPRNSTSKSRTAQPSTRRDIPRCQHEIERFRDPEDWLPARWSLRKSRLTGRRIRARSASTSGRASCSISAWADSIVLSSFRTWRSVALSRALLLSFARSVRYARRVRSRRVALRIPSRTTRARLSRARTIPRSQRSAAILVLRFDAHGIGGSLHATTFVQGQVAGFVLIRSPPDEPAP